MFAWLNFFSGVCVWVCSFVNPIKNMDSFHYFQKLCMFKNKVMKKEKWVTINMQ